MSWIAILILFFCVSCGTSVCILGQGTCPDSSVSTPVKKALDVSASVTTIYSNSQNGPITSDLSLSNGTTPYSVSIPSTTTVAHFLDPNNTANQVKTVSTSQSTIRLYSNTGVNTQTEVIVTISDSSNPVVTKNLVITVKP